MRRTFVPLLLVLLCAEAAFAASAPPIAGEWDAEKAPCAAGLHAQPNGKYSVMLFCEEALGTYLVVVRTSPLGAPADGHWKLDDRLWYEGLFGADVTGYRLTRGSIRRRV